MSDEELATAMRAYDLAEAAFLQAQEDLLVALDSRKLRQDIRAELAQGRLRAAEAESKRAA